MSGSGGGLATNTLPASIDLRFVRLFDRAYGYFLEQAVADNPYEEGEDWLLYYPGGIYGNVHSGAITPYETRLDALDTMITNESLVGDMWSAQSLLSVVFPDVDILGAVEHLVNNAVACAQNSAAQALVDGRAAATGIMEDSMLRARSAADNIIGEADSILSRLLPDMMTSRTDDMFTIAIQKSSQLADAATARATATLGDAHNASQIISMLPALRAETTTGATAFVTAAIASALNAVTLLELTAVVEEYEVETLPNLYRAVNRFTSGLADIGAGESSAMGMGLALIHSEHQSDVRKFRAQLSTEIYKDSLTLFSSTFNSHFVGGLQSLMTELELYRNLYAQEKDNAQGMFLELFKEYLVSYLGLIPQFISFHEGVRKSSESVSLGAYGSSIEAFRSSLASWMQSHADLKLQKEKAKDTAITQIPLLEREHKFKMAELRNAHVVVDTEWTRLMTVALTDYYEADMERKAKASEWKMRIAQEAANILAAPSGAAVVPSPPSRGASAISGALAGGIAGGKFGVPGAAIGGFLGLLGGALS